MDSERVSTDPTSHAGERGAFEDLENVLRRNGFVKCDIAACNCGSWHARFGYPERMQEIKDALAEADHPVCNENGGLISKALAELIAERDSLRAALQAPKRTEHHLREALQFFVSHPGVSQLCTPNSEAMRNARAALAAPTSEPLPTDASSGACSHSNKTDGQASGNKQGATHDQP